MEIGAEDDDEQRRLHSTKPEENKITATFQAASILYRLLAARQALSPIFLARNIRQVQRRLYCQNTGEDTAAASFAQMGMDSDMVSCGESLARNGAQIRHSQTQTAHHEQGAHNRNSPTPARASGFSHEIPTTWSPTGHGIHHHHHQQLNWKKRLQNWWPWRL